MLQVVKLVEVDADRRGGIAGLMAESGLQARSSVAVWAFAAKRLEPTGNDHFCYIRSAEKPGTILWEDLACWEVLDPSLAGSSWANPGGVGLGQMGISMRPRALGFSGHACPGRPRIFSNMANQRLF
jgi:hypothetical protein